MGNHAPPAVEPLMVGEQECAQGCFQYQGFLLGAIEHPSAGNQALQEATEDLQPPQPLPESTGV